MSLSEAKFEYMEKYILNYFNFLKIILQCFTNLGNIPKRLKL